MTWWLSLARRRRSPIERGVAADLGFHRERADLSGAARQPQIQPAQGLAVVAGHRAELDVEIEIGLLLLGLLGRLAGERGFHEIAPVIDVAAHGDVQHAVAAAIGLQRHLVAAGQREDRQIGRHDIAGVVEFDRAFHIGARAVDRQIVEAHRFRRLAERVSRPRRLAGRLLPARQQVVDSGRREIGFHFQPVVGGVVVHAAGDVDRNDAGDAVAEIDPQAVAGGLVELGLQVQFGVAVLLFLDIERGRRAVDFDVALDLVAGVGRAHPQRGRLDLAPEQHLVGGKIGHIRRDGIGWRNFSARSCRPRDRR